MSKEILDYYVHFLISKEDILAFKNVGAYCFSMTSNYNSRFIPAEIIWYNNDAHIIRKRETLKDLIHNQVLLNFKEKVEA